MRTERDVRENPVAGERYFMGSDQSGHWYVIPVARQKEWSAWCDLDEDDEDWWDAPDYAVSVGGSPTLVTFSDYRIGGHIAQPGGEA